jgi:hypothetical protein
MMSGMSWSGRPVPSAALRSLILLPGGIPGVRFDYGSVAITGTPKPAVGRSHRLPALAGLRGMCLIDEDRETLTLLTGHLPQMIRAEFLDRRDDDPGSRLNCLPQPA